MPPSRPGSPEIVFPFCEARQVVSHPRYNWKCWDRGKNPFVLIQWTHSGEGIFESAYGRLPVPADHAFVALLPEKASYYYATEKKEPWILSWLNFYGELALGLFADLRAAHGPVIPLSPVGAAAASFRRLLAEGARSGGRDRIQTSVQVYAFLLEWWQEAAQPSGGAESRLARALRFTRDHFRERLGVKQMAAEAGMSREHFSRIFAHSTGETPAISLQRLRLEEAENLIRETELPLREVAMRSGFYSERHLMRTFQRVRGVNPSSYRRRRAPAHLMRPGKRKAAPR